MALPVPRNASRGAWHWLIDRVMVGAREHWALDDRVGAVVPEPVFPRLEALDHRVTGLARVVRGVLARRGVAASDVAAERTATKVEPPPPSFQALNAPSAARPHRWINLVAGHHRSKSYEARRRVDRVATRSLTRVGSRQTGRPQTVEADRAAIDPPAAVVATVVIDRLLPSPMQKTPGDSARGAGLSGGDSP
jgi:hypothetical protein